MNNPKRAGGQGLVEYALLLVLVAVVVIVVLAALGNQVNAVFARVVAALDGQAIMGTGTEYVITGFSVDSQPDGFACTVTANDIGVTVFIDGELAPSGTIVSATGRATGGTQGSGSATTGANGSATISTITSTNAACSGSMEVTVGSSTRSESY